MFNCVCVFPLNTTLSGFSNSKVRLFGYFKDAIQIGEFKCNVVDDDAMFYDVIIGLNVLMQDKTKINENGITIRNKPKCTEELPTLSVLPINLSPDDIEINIAPDIHDQRTVTVSLVVRVPVELQYPFDLPKLEDNLKRLQRSDPVIKCITEKPDEYIVADTEELHLENCLKDEKEDKACIPLKKTDPVVVVPKSVPKEVKRRAHEKRRPRIKENKDYYFIPKRKKKLENSVAHCDHRVLVNHKRREKEDVPLKTCHTDHLGKHRITNFDEGYCLADQPIPRWPWGADGYLEAPPLTARSRLSVLGAWLSVAPSTSTLKGADAIETRYDAIEGRRRRG
ncbi:elongation factor 2 [Trichonephila inaurata madagascariensis]|uniref:Elongation factor 2 n=1 Tax=Trichonephila inaurata madagascariensis TaxID=2747483 RepID=A0A8X6Y5M3_9ARAC|nr:elongation factor 2 [Trichonephila inaurata madagascariensis]